MNTPTPLGKTYEQYKKELKEFNLSKVEKVELASVAELKKALGIIEKEFKMMDSNKKIFIKEMEQAKLSIWVDADQAEKLLNRTIHPILNKFDKAAKELGVKPTDVTEYKKVVKERDALEQRITKQKKEYK